MHKLWDRQARDTIKKKADNTMFMGQPKNIDEVVVEKTSAGVTNLYEDAKKNLNKSPPAAVFHYKGPGPESAEKKVAYNPVMVSELNLPGRSNANLGAQQKVLKN